MREPLGARRGISTRWYEGVDSEDGAEGLEEEEEEEEEPDGDEGVDEDGAGSGAGTEGVGAEADAVDPLGAFEEPPPHDAQRSAASTITGDFMVPPP